MISEETKKEAVKLLKGSSANLMTSANNIELDQSDRNFLIQILTVGFELSSLQKSIKNALERQKETWEKEDKDKV